MGVVFLKNSSREDLISKMKLILMSLLVLGPCYGMDAMFKKIMKQTAKHTFDAACFGETNKNNYDLAVGAAIEKCLQLAPAIDLINILSPSSPFTSLFPSVNTKNPFRQFQEYQDIDQLVSLWRSKRSADSEITTGLLQPDEADFMGEMATKMGNLTCVLTEMKLLTPELKVNIEEYTKDLAEYEEYDLSESPIVEDPEWRARLSRGYQDCYDISESIPSAALSGSPLKRMFGRQMIFFKCAKKNEMTNCALGQMKRWLEQFYGVSENNTAYGLPEDDYEAAGLGLMVLDNAASEEEKFVSDFFWGVPEM